METRRQRCGVCVPLCGCIVALSWILNFICREPTSEASTSAIQHITWNHKQNLLVLTPNQTQPAYLLNTSANLWTSVAQWNSTEHLLQHHPGPLTHVKVSHNNTFILGDVGTETSKVTFINTTLQNFLTTSGKLPLHYWSGPVEQWGYQLGHKEISPNDQFCGEGKHKRDCHAIFWLSQPNVTAHTHFDPSHNFFVQLLGRKTFYLTPPGTYQPYTHIHPRKRQAMRKRKTRSHVQELVVELTPGSVLYVPPFWFHRVVSHSLSVSVSFINPAQEERTFAQIKKLGLPFGAAKTWPETVRVVHHFTHLLVSSLAIENVENYVWQLFGIRKRKKKDKNGPKQNWFDCHFNADYNAERWQPTLMDTVADARKIFLDLTADEDVRDIFVADFLMEMAAWLLGRENTDTVEAFWRDCFQPAKSQTK
eukprot:TRINITY_DN68183_c5_g2_i2.p1 TRINITY_DN68183_c5_g2~~TRINITY_DN68183_c5_g2_i2.p1  ORF type:complete len:422 (-),score=14.83 TRINITY_DN68183_c5_g2_i2:133-1398(-)